MSVQDTRKPLALVESQQYHLMLSVNEISESGTGVSLRAYQTSEAGLSMHFLWCRGARESAGSELLQGGQKLRKSRDAKVYIEYLLISRLVITVSFLPIVWNDLQSHALVQAAQIGLSAFQNSLWLAS